MKNDDKLKTERSLRDIKREERKARYLGTMQVDTPKQKEKFVGSFKPRSPEKKEEMAVDSFREKSPVKKISVPKLALETIVPVEVEVVPLIYKVGPIVYPSKKMLEINIPESIAEALNITDI